MFGNLIQVGQDCVSTKLLCEAVFIRAQNARALQLTAVGNDNLLGGLARLRAVRLNLGHNVQALSDLSKDSVLAVQPLHVISTSNTNINARTAVLAVQIKNCDPLVLGPALAMDKIPAPVCFKVKFSSANLAP